MSEKQTIQTTVEVFFAYSEAVKRMAKITNPIIDGLLLTLFGAKFWPSLHNLLTGSLTERKIEPDDTRFIFHSDNTKNIAISELHEGIGDYRYEVTFTEQVGELSDEAFDGRNSRISESAKEVADDVADQVQIAQTQFKDIFQIFTVTARSIRYNN